MSKVLFSNHALSGLFGPRPNSYSIRYVHRQRLSEGLHMWMLTSVRHSLSYPRLSAILSNAVGNKDRAKRLLFQADGCFLVSQS